MNIIPTTTAMLAMLTLLSMSMFAIAVMVPEAAPVLDLDSRYIGPLNSLIYLVAAISGSLSSRYIQRYGSIRVCQICLGSAALGLATYATGESILLPLCALFLGIAYGPYNPASAHVLADITTDQSRPLVFSIKQLGVPVGGMLAGATLPILTIWLGWQIALLCVAGFALLIAVLVQPLHQAEHSARIGTDPMSSGGLLNCILLIFRDAHLRRYTLVAFVFAGAQVCSGAFIVIYLNEELSMSLVNAGLVLAVMQLGGIAGRLAWGATAERHLRSTTTLALIGAMAACCLLLTAHIDSSWPFAAIMILSGLLGFSAFGWNGVVLSKIATLAPAGRSADATGGMQFVMFGGVVIFPSLFALLIGFTGGYQLPFYLLSGVSICGVLIVLGERHARSSLR